MGLGRGFRRNGGGPGHGSGRASGKPEPWLYRKVRGLRPDRNSLRRRTDRVEAYLLAGLFVAAAAGAPFAAQAASHAAYADALRLQQQQLATRHQVSAVLAQAAATSISGYTISADVPTKASWTSITGVHRSGEVLAESGSPKGAVVTLWTDSRGDLTSPPLIAAEVVGQGDAATIGAVAGVVAVFLAAAGTTHYLLYRRRIAAWDADWLVTAPTWNHQSW